MARSQTAAEFGALVQSLFQRSALIELAVVAGCLLVAWLVSLGVLVDTFETAVPWSRQ